MLYKILYVDFELVVLSSHSFIHVFIRSFMWCCCYSAHSIYIAWINSCIENSHISLLILILFTIQGAFTQIKCSSPLYIGGVPEYDKTKKTAGVIKPFTGIIQKVLPLTHTLYLMIKISVMRILRGLKQNTPSSQNNGFGTIIILPLVFCPIFVLSTRVFFMMCLL